MTDEQRLEETAAFSADGIHHTRVAALRRLPVRQRVLLAADWAEAVLPIWERQHPADGRPRRAVEAARTGDVEAAYAASSSAYASSSASSSASAAFAASSASFAASSAAYAAASAASAASFAASSAAYAAADVAYVAYAAVSAAFAASSANAAAWDGVRRLWDAAYNAGHAWRSEWRTPLAVEMARDLADYPVLLDLLEERGAPVEGLRAARWARSNWAVFHLMKGSE